MGFLDLGAKEAGGRDLGAREAATPPGNMSGTAGVDLALNSKLNETLNEAQWRARVNAGVSYSTVAGSQRMSSHNSFEHSNHNGRGSASADIYINVLVGHTLKIEGQSIVGGKKITIGNREASLVIERLS